MSDKYSAKAGVGPVYGVPLIDSLPLNDGGAGTMKQVMPSESDLNDVMGISVRTVAGYEVLLNHWRAAKTRIAELEKELASKS